MRLEDPGTGKRRIVDLFTDLGGAVTMRHLAREAIGRGFWSEAELDGAVLGWAVKQCRDVIRSEGENGLPFAVPVEKGPHPVWKQLTLIDSLEEANFVLQERAAAVVADHAKLLELQRYFVRRFGGGISSVPMLVY